MRPTEWSAVSNSGAGNQRFYNYVYMCAILLMYMYTCTRMHYAAIQVNRPSGISQAAAISVNGRQGVKRKY